MRLRHKFNAKRCETDNIKFPSKLERDCYLALKQLQKEGKILFFLRQIGFDLPATRYHVDFEVFYPDEVKFVESKGIDLEAGRLRRMQAEELYGIKIHVVTKPSMIYQLDKV